MLTDPGDRSPPGTVQGCGWIVGHALDAVVVPKPVIETVARRPVRSTGQEARRGSGNKPGRPSSVNGDSRRHACRLRLGRWIPGDRSSEMPVQAETAALDPPG